MKNYAIENEMLKHPQIMLIPSFKLKTATSLQFSYGILIAVHQHLQFCSIFSLEMVY